MIKTILFDWSGVINNNLPTAHETAMLVFDRYGAPRISVEEFQREWEQPFMNFYHKYLPRLSRKDVDSIYADVYRCAELKHPPSAYPGMQDAIWNFKKAGIEMIVVSSDLPENLFGEIKAFSLEGAFPEVNTNVYDKSTVALEVIKRNSLSPKETLFVGDTTHEIEAGKNAKTQTAAVTWGFQHEAKLKAASPDYVVHSVRELVDIIGRS